MYKEEVRLELEIPVVPYAAFSPNSSSVYHYYYFFFLVLFLSLREVSKVYKTPVQLPTFCPFSVRAGEHLLTETYKLHHYLMKCYRTHLNVADFVKSVNLPLI